MLQFNQTAREFRSSRWSPGAIVEVLRWRHRLIAASILACLAVALAYLAVAPARYLATSVLLTETKRSPEAAEAAGDAAVDSTVVETQIEAVRSATLALRVIDKLKLVDDPEFGVARQGLLSRLFSGFKSDEQAEIDRRAVALANLREKIGIKRVGRSYVAEITVTALDAQKAAKIANAVAESYITEQLGSRQESQQRSNDWMESRMLELREQATRAEKAAQAAASSNGASASSGTGGDELAFRDLQAKAQIAKANYEAFLSRYTQALQLQQVAIPSTEARVLTWATPPSRPGSPRTGLVLVLSLIAGGTLGVLAAFGAEFLQSPMRSRAQLMAALGIRTFDPVPLSKVRTGLFGRNKGLPVALVGEQGSGVAENALRKVKLAIDQSDPQKASRVIGVTSPLAKDGKTTVAYSLALLFAQGGRRTLLIDANTHNPTLAQTFCEPGMGLLTVFLTTTDDTVVAVTPSEKLSIIGDQQFLSQVHPADAFGSSAMLQALARAQKSFDIVIVDLPPIADNVEVRAIAPLLDRILVVTTWGSELAVLERALESADALVSRVLGIIINKAPTARTGGFVRPITAPRRLKRAVETV